MISSIINNNISVLYYISGNPIISVPAVPECSPDTSIICPIPTFPSVANSASSSPFSDRNKKNLSTKKVYDGLRVLNDKRLQKTDIDSKFKNELYDLKLKKAKIDYETSQIENTLMTQKLKFEVEKLESEARQNKIKEELLLLELNHKKKMLGFN